MLTRIAESIFKQGGRAYLVGGSLRDKFMGISPKDFDVEVFGLSHEDLIRILEQFGKVDTVGKSFGVTKLWIGDQDYDFSLPRRESLVGKGHKGFQVECDPNMTLKEAAARRDYTINSMSQDILTGHINDFFCGKEDLQFGRLNHTSEHFCEDPLRVLRGFQFAARFGFLVGEFTAKICQELTIWDIPKERIWMEWEKWAIKGKFPSYGLDFLMDTDWIQYFPEIHSMHGVQQDPEWHPEGDVWNHTLHTLEAMADICHRDKIEGEDRAVLIFAALLHDVGKPSTSTVNDNGRTIAPNHHTAGVPIAEQFLNRIGAYPRIIERVLPLVQEHMAHIFMKDVTDKGLRKLAIRLQPESIENWGRLVEADHSGRPPLKKGNPSTEFVERARILSLEKAPPSPILMGRHLIEEGLTPGPEFGKILKEAYDAQIAGEFADEAGAMKWLYHSQFVP